MYHRSSQQEKQEHGNGRADQDTSHRRRRCSFLQNQPGQRNRLEAIAQRGNDLPAPQKAKQRLANARNTIINVVVP